MSAGEHTTRAAAIAAERAGGVARSAIAEAVAAANERASKRAERAAGEVERALHRWAARPKCSVCGTSMAVSNRDRHYACDPMTIVGTRCVCPPKCSDAIVGSGAAGCVPECVPCRMLQGQPFQS